MTCQYMESNKQFKLDLIGIDNPENVRYIVSVNASLFHETLMSVNKYDSLKFDNNSQSNSDRINNGVT